MKAGFFSMDITPSYGMEMPGDYVKRYAEAIHDPLEVHAAVFDDGERVVALAGVG